MYLVFDVGGTFTKYACMNQTGEILEKGKTPTPVKPGTKPEEFIALLGDIYDSYKAKEKIEGIAISLPGMIDVENGIVYGGGNLTYMDRVHLGALLSKRCDNLHVALENDAKCAALAEVWKGNAQDVSDACLLILGTGVGGAIVKDKKIHRGKHLSAGEFSFVINNMSRSELPVKMNAENRPIGVAEFLDLVPYMGSSNVAVAGLCNKVSHLKRMPYEEVNGEKIYQWIEQGDSQVNEIVEDMYFDIAKLCCNLQAIYDPEVILIGGGISAEPRFVEGIKRYVEELKALTMVFENIRIQPCRYLNDSNLIGALYHYSQRYDITL